MVETERDQLEVFRRWWAQAGEFARAQAVKEWERHLELFSHEGASIDILNCWYGTDTCKCPPACSICGHGKHSPFHGPVFGKPVGSPPWGHEYTPNVPLNDVQREILRGLGR